MNLFHTHTGWQARHNVSEVLKSGRLSEGCLVRQFEQRLTEEFNLTNPVCTNSGTSALHLALKLAGVIPGSEVILPAQTFIATGLAVLYCGARPVFADVNPKTGLLDPEAVGQCWTPYTRAVMPVHWCGMPCDVEAVRKACLQPYIVSDAAQALGAMLKGKSLDAWGDFTVYSFQATKHLTTGDGGCVAGLTEEEAKRVRKLRWFGFDRDEDFDPIEERPTLPNEIGYKYHMNDLAASVGLGNVEGLYTLLYRRRVIAARYREELAGVPGLELPPMPLDRTHAYYAFPVLVDRRQDFTKALGERKVPCSVICRRIDRLPVFGGRADLGLRPGTDEFDAKQINLPCRPALTDAEVRQVIEAVRAGW